MNYVLTWLGSPVSFFKSRHGWRLLFPVSAVLKHREIRVSAESVMFSGTGENRFHSVRTADGCCGRQKVRLGVTVAVSRSTGRDTNVCLKRRACMCARSSFQTHLNPCHMTNPTLLNPHPVPSLPSPVQWHIRIEMQLRCLTESILGSCFFLASSFVMHFSKHAQEQPSYVYILLTFQTSKAARKMQESVDSLLFPGQISNNSCNQICHRFPQKSLGSVLEVSYVFTLPPPNSPQG